MIFEKPQESDRTNSAARSQAKITRSSGRHFCGRTPTVGGFTSFVRHWWLRFLDGRGGSGAVQSRDPFSQEAGVTAAGFHGMGARLVLLYRRPARGQRGKSAGERWHAGVMAWRPCLGCAGRQRRQRAASGLASEKNALSAKESLKFSCKMLGGLEQGAANLLKTTSPFAKNHQSPWEEP